MSGRKNGSYENMQHAHFDTFFEYIFEKKSLIDIIKNFIYFSEGGTPASTTKFLTDHQQSFAVKKAVVSTK
jgi:type I restriction enzyme R subunit